MRSSAVFTAASAVMCAAALLLATPPLAQAQEKVETTADALVPVTDYTRGLSLAARSPATAREAAARWEAIGGGAEARHCAAMALIGLGADREAAKILTEIGSGPGALCALDRASALRLAGGLWLNLDQPKLARLCFERALKHEPGVRDALVGAARSAAAAPTPAR